MFIVSNNDGWFGKSILLEPVSETCAECTSSKIEPRWFRVANTGWTGLIDASGRMHSGLPVRHAGNIAVPALVGKGMPLAARAAVLWDWVLVLAGAGLGVWSVWQRRRGVVWDMLQS